MPERVTNASCHPPECKRRYGSAELTVKRSDVVLAISNSRVELGLTTRGGELAIYYVGMTSRHRRSGWHRHSLTCVSSCILLLWIVLYIVSNEHTHMGAFYGNAIADWTGLVVMILATKHLYEKGSPESKQPPPDILPGHIEEFVRDHSLTIFFIATGAVWIVLYFRMSPESKWGQVVGNIVSEWTQVLGVVLLTKKLIEIGSKEGGR